MPLASDDFNRADASDLGASWDVTPGMGSGFSIASNVILPTDSANDSVETNNTVTWPNDQYSEVVFFATAANGVGSGLGPVCRGSNAAVTHYRCAGNLSGYELARVVAGAYTPLSSGIGTTFAAADRLRLQVVTNGANCDWVLSKNSVVFASGTDTSPIASGRAGMVYSSTDAAARIDSWEGDASATTALLGARRGLGPGRGPRKRVLARATRSFGDVSSVSLIAGAISINIAPVGAMTGSGALVGAVPISINPVGAMSGTGALAGVISVSISPVGALKGTGALIGAIPLAINIASALTGTGALLGAVPVSFVPVGALTGTGSLTGTVAVSFNIAGTLAAAGGGAITGAVPIDFTVVGALTGTGSLSGAVGISFSPVGALTDANAPVTDQTVTGGGYAFLNDFDAHRESRRSRKRLEDERKHEADEIQAELDRDIAKLLHEQEAKDAERDDLKRIQVLADQYAGTKQQVPRHIAASLLKAQEERSRNALEQLQREIDRMLEEEEAHIQAILLMDD